jgi:hypothetical protein
MEIMIFGVHNMAPVKYLVERKLPRGWKSGLGVVAFLIVETSEWTLD